MSCNYLIMRRGAGGASTLIKQAERAVFLSLLFTFLFFFGFGCKLLSQLPDGSGIAGVQPVVPPFLRTFNDALRLSCLLAQILLRETMDFLQVRLIEKSTKMVVDVLGQLVDADTARAYIQ
mgnify:CR=1 FL=1